MSVLVKGMRMPQSCYYCGLADTSFINCVAFEKPIVLEDDCEERRPDWCPLVAVPHHGRLIDMDGEIVVKTTIMRGEDCNVDLSAPVIMPAEEGE